MSVKTSTTMTIAESFINMPAFVTSSKLARLEACNQFDKNVTDNGKDVNIAKNDIFADVVSRKGNYLIHEDMKASQVINIISAQVGNLNGEKEYTTKDDVCHCVLEMIPYFLIEKNDPIYVVVEVIEGTAKIGTPICIPSRDSIYIGRIASIKDYDKPMNCAGKREVVTIKIVCEANVEQPKLFQRQAYARDLLVSCNRRAA